MRKINFSILEWIILIIFLSFITLDVFFDILISFFDIILFSNHFSNPYNFVKFLANNTTFLCGVVWLNKLLLLIAGIIPVVFCAIFLKEIDMPFWIKTFLIILIYYIVLQLFASLIFWIVVGSLIFSFILYKFITIVRQKKASIKTDNKPAKS